MKYRLWGWMIAGMSWLGCSRGMEYRQAEGKIYGTFYHISYEWDQDLHRDILRAMDSVDASLSMFNPLSVIAAVNRDETDRVDGLFLKMFGTAMRVYAATEGGYDITVAPLVDAWGFGAGKRAFPDSARIGALLASVGMDKLSLKEGRLLKKAKGMKLDAGSIAKGLGVDLVAECFDRRGIRNYMVEIGGEVRAKGESGKRRSWRIGIDRPQEDVTGQSRQLQLVVGLTSGALATSGNYRNFYVHEGRKYAHTIDPRSGYPVQTEVVSASVFASSCMEADAYATGFMVIGLEKAKRILDGDSGLEGCLIYVENGTLKTWVSDGLKKRIVPERGS